MNTLNKTKEALLKDLLRNITLLPGEGHLKSEAFTIYDALFCVQDQQTPVEDGVLIQGASELGLYYERRVSESDLRDLQNKLKLGNKIQAIKALRTIFAEQKMELQEAKALCERIEEDMQKGKTI